VRRGWLERAQIPVDELLDDSGVKIQQPGGVLAALAPTGMSVSYPEERLDEHALVQYPSAGKEYAREFGIGLRCSRMSKSRSHGA
jgi:hypothetical protein